MKMQLFVFVFVIFCEVMAAPFNDSNVDSKEWCDGKPADIVFLLDSSSSIWKPDYEKQLQFISDVIDMFQISHDHTRVALAAFSNNYRQFINFDSFESKEKLRHAVQKVPQLYGNTYTGNALYHLRNRGFAKARQGVAHIAIVFTDGVSINKKRTKEEAEMLKRNGVYVFAIGVGDEFDKDELKAIGSEPSDDFVYDVDKYDMLESIRKTLAFKACSVEPVTEAPLPQKDQPACGMRGKADMMFCFDSAAAGSSRSKILYSFITEISKDFNMEESIRVGVMSRNCHEHDIHLDEYIDKDALVGAIKEIEFQGLGPVVENMWKHGFKESHGGRNEARKVAVLFVDEDTEKLDSVIAESIKAKEQGIEVYVVCIGSVDFEAIRWIASEPTGHHVIKVSSYKDVPMLKEDFVNSVCQDL